MSPAVSWCHDILTGLVNRTEFESRLERALKSAKAREASYALCYLDLDQFKIVNDSCGHSAGDALLGQLGALLKSKIRWRDTLARLGGDEFGVLLESCSLDEALKTAEVLRLAISEFKFMWDDRSFRLHRCGANHCRQRRCGGVAECSRQCLCGSQGSRP
jgi:diguanylate cyclase (GGDEF)-like protein